MVSAFSGYTLHMVKERLERAHLLLNCIGPEMIYITSTHMLFMWPTRMKEHLRNELLAGHYSPAVLYNIEGITKNFCCDKIYIA